MASGKKVLIVEDENAIRDMVKFALDNAGFQTDTAATVQQARVAIADGLPDLLLLDWMLPDLSGLEFARQLKKDDVTEALPIIMLTARGEEMDKIRGLETGADDYVTKPFSPKELVARIKAVLRRSGSANDDAAIEADGLRLDPISHRVSSLNGEQQGDIEMGPSEFRLLQFFMCHPERVYSRGQLLDLVWGGNVYIEERTVDVHIRRLRKALEPSGHDRLVQTVRGAGYRFSLRT